MACFLEFSELFAEYGVSRGISGLFCLSECNEDIQNHLASLHLSRSRLTERDVILARAGMFELDETVIENMKICAKHRHILGKCWRPSTACLYPAHQGGPGKRSSKSRYSVSLDMSIMYGILVPVGSGEQ